MVNNYLPFNSLQHNLQLDSSRLVYKSRCRLQICGYNRNHLLFLLFMESYFFFFTLFVPYIHSDNDEQVWSDSVSLSSVQQVTAASIGQFCLTIWEITLAFVSSLYCVPIDGFKRVPEAHVCDDCCWHLPPLQSCQSTSLAERLSTCCSISSIESGWFSYASGLILFI